jgi:hypothetical protein
MHLRPKQRLAKPTPTTEFHQTTASNVADFGFGVEVPAQHAGTR